MSQSLASTTNLFTCSLVLFLTSVYQKLQNVHVTRCDCFCNALSDKTRFPPCPVETSIYPNAKICAGCHAFSLAQVCFNASQKAVSSKKTSSFNSVEEVSDFPQKMPHFLPFPPSFSLLPFSEELFRLCGGMFPPPEAAARIAAIRCFARSSPWSAARTYQTFASRGSRRQPMPISVK